MRRALGEHELAESLHSEPAPTDTPDGREPGVVPPADDAAVDEPVEFPLGQERVDEV